MHTQLLAFMSALFKMRCDICPDGKSSETELWIFLKCCFCTEHLLEAKMSSIFNNINFRHLQMADEKTAFAFYFTDVQNRQE
jgi:hypothetical protein